MYVVSQPSIDSAAHICGNAAGEAGHTVQPAQLFLTLSYNTFRSCRLRVAAGAPSHELLHADQPSKLHHSLSIMSIIPA